MPRLIPFDPPRGRLLICDFDMGAPVPPEMRKVRRVAVVSPRSYNRRQGGGPGRCLVVPFSATEPDPLRPAHLFFPPGPYRSLGIPTWALCDLVMPVSHRRLNRVRDAGEALDENLTPEDWERLEAGLQHALGIE